MRGPAGGRLVWRPEQQEPVQLIAGGSGVVPLMAIIRAHALADSRAPLRLLYSARQPGSVIYHAELKRRDTTTAHLSVTYAYTRTAPPGAALPPGRIDARLLARVTWPPALAATCYIAGPAAFVDTITRLLTSIGHHSDRFRTEHFTAPQPAPPIGAEAGHRLPGTERAA